VELEELVIVVRKAFEAASARVWLMLPERVGQASFQSLVFS